MCFWYDFGLTLQKLESIGKTGEVLSQIINKVEVIKQDFEVKRFVLGLSSLIVNSDMPQAVKDNYCNIIKALIYLSDKSIKIRGEERQKPEEAEVEHEAPGQIIEDEEDDIGVDIESDEDEDDWGLSDEEDVDGDDQLYDSPLDKIDEVIHFHQQLAKL